MSLTVDGYFPGCITKKSNLTNPGGLLETPLELLVKSYWLAKQIDYSINLSYSLLFDGGTTDVGSVIGTGSIIAPVSGWNAPNPQARACLGQGWATVSLTSGSCSGTANPAGGAPVSYSFALNSAIQAFNYIGTINSIAAVAAQKDDGSNNFLWQFNVGGLLSYFQLIGWVSGTTGVTGDMITSGNANFNIESLTYTLPIYWDADLRGATGTLSGSVDITISDYFTP